MQFTESSLQPTKIMPPITKGKENMSPGRSNLAIPEPIFIWLIFLSGNIQVDRNPMHASRTGTHTNQPGKHGEMHT